MWTMAEVPGVIVLDDEGVERLAIARLYGGITSGDPSDPQAMSPPKEKIDKYIWRVPYEIGRTPTHTPDGNHFEINDGKVSRHHATIGYDEVSGSFKLTCHSSNGVDCNGRHVERNEECELPSRSAIRIGPFYGVLLLPAKEPLSLTAPLPSFGRAPAGAGGGKTFRPAVSYKQMVTEIYDKLLHEYGWFTVLDMARLARREYPDHNLPDEDEKLKDGIKRYLSKPDSGFDVAGADQVPRPIFDQLSANHMHKQKQWYRRISPEAVAAKVAGDKSKKAAKTAAVGGAAPIASAGQLQLQAAGLGGPGLRAADATAGEAATAGDGAADNIVNISDEDDDAAEGGGDGPAADADDLMYDD